MKNIGIVALAVLFLAVGNARAADGKSAKLTCCQEAQAKKEECKHRCCINAHKEKKSCVKCNPNQEDLKKGPKNPKN